jgi:hypothetical protein
MSALSAATGLEPLTTSECRPVVQQDVAFNYASLDPDVAVGAREAAQRIQTRLRNDIIEIGRDLIAVKERMEHGAFGAWVRAELQITMRSAENYMNGSRLLARKSETVSHLPPSIIYALAAPSAPVAVVDKLIDDVEAGATITVAQIKTAIQAERNAKIEAAKSPDQIKKDQEAHETRAKRAARREANARAVQKKWEDAAQERADRLRPLAERIVACIGPDLLAEMLRTLNDYNDRSTLRGLLTECAAELAAAHAEVPA